MKEGIYLINSRVKTLIELKQVELRYLDEEYDYCVLNDMSKEYLTGKKDSFKNEINDLMSVLKLTTDILNNSKE